jgi:predicted RNA binding protein YcfA (HicA-like mRNA interferase family)
MGKLRVLSGKEICDILASEGFRAARQEGSHVSMVRDSLDSTVTVPVPLHKEVAVGTLANIIRLSGVDRRLFETS